MLTNFSDLGLIKNYLEEATKHLMIEFGETCPHWIDYEIYYNLREDLREKYSNQFSGLEIIYMPAYENQKPKVEIRCRANNFYQPHCDCSKHYPKTIKCILKQIKKMLKPLKKE